MADIWSPNNPGISGLKELTSGELATVQALGALGDPNADRIVGWDDTDNTYKYFTIGTNLSYDHSTHTLSSTGGSGTGDVSSNTATSVDGEIALFSSTTGKIIKRATGSGIVKVTSGVFGTATSGTDYQVPITLTTTGTSGNATFSAGTLNIPNYTYTLPTASTSILGGVKIDGTSITITGGVISATTGGSGTVTSVASADGSITVTNPTTTVDLAVVKAPKWTTARNLAGNSVDGSANVAFANKFIVQGTTDAGLSAAQFLGALTTGIVKNTTSTGVLSIAIAADFPTLNQSTTGNAATATALATGRTISISGDLTYASPSFDGSGNVTASGTLATVNTNVGSFTYASITVNGKGLITAASNGTAPLTNPMTTLGDIIYENVTPAATRLAGNTTATKNFLTQTGTGTVSAAPSWGTIASGDVPTLNQNTTGSAATLTTPRAINGVNFDGSAAITVTAAAGTLTGTTLNSTVVTSSLTSVGTITTGVWTGTTIAIANGGTGQTSKAAAFDALSPMSASGDIIYGGASGTGTRLAKGSDTQVLTLASGLPTWASPSAAFITSVTSPLVVTTGNLTINQSTTSTAGYLSFGDWNTFNNKAPTANPTFTGTVNAATIIASGNVSGNNFLEGYTTTATAAGTTTLTVSSTGLQYFTGSTTQTVVLPVTSTLVLGQTFYIANLSTGAVTVQSSGANTIFVLAGGTISTFTCVLTSGTTAASWTDNVWNVGAASGKAATFNNSITFSGTDTTTMTFPTTSATIARTDAAQTFTGVQTLSSAPVLSTGTVTVSGNAITFPAAAGTLATLAGTETLTNKRITARIGSTSSSSTPTPVGDSNDLYEVTALAANATIGTPGGTPTDGQKLILRITPDATPRTLAFNAIYRASSDLALPTTTIASKTMYLGFIYNSLSSKWDFIAFLNNF